MVIENDGVYMSNTVFNNVQYTLGSLVGDISSGVIGLPDIQRPFVWKNAKVRNLFDSMYKGYPVGYFLFWVNSTSDDGKRIGTDEKQRRVPSQLIVDGQQRLTSLYAVVRAIPVVRENYEIEQIEIAFNPLLEKFEVADAAIRRDKTYIPNISVIWEDNANIFKLVQDYLDSLGESREVTSEERIIVQNSVMKLSNLLGFPFTVLELSAQIDVEQVSDVFVRINSEGKKLNQSDFILTLMSVFWDEGRSNLEDFCRLAKKPTTGEASPFNHFLQPKPDQLLRVSVSLAFRRARLQYIYSILRGKDLETGQFSTERRDAQFERLKQVQEKVLNIQYWHDFHKCLLQAGFRSGKLISSDNNLLFAYILYLMGRTEYKLEEFRLRRVIGQWFFMSAITGRFTGSPETAMEFDLRRFDKIETADEFEQILLQVCQSTLTQDYWGITLPTELATAAAVSPSMFAYFAALNILDARVLFSQQKVAELMDPATQAPRSSLERHHLFPKAYLKTLEITQIRETNQIANFAMVEWGDNGKIADLAPSEYVPKLSERFSEQELMQMYEWHALPMGWENMEYQDFLLQRRELMAHVICNGYKVLVGDKERYVEEVLPIASLVEQGECITIEFKSTLRKNLHTTQNDPRMEIGVLKTIAAFLNSKGGKLVIGVADDGSPVGIQEDGFANDDKFALHLDNLIRTRLGIHLMLYIHPRFDEHDGVTVMIVDCQPAKKPAFVKDGQVERFFVRTAASSMELTGSQMNSYIQDRF